MIEYFVHKFIIFYNLISHKKAFVIIILIKPQIGEGDTLNKTYYKTY